MCQSKQNGGKRCFAHHWGTKASLSYIHAKTGVDKTQIYAIMKELNKEGRKLNPPSEAELENYFKLEEFKTKYDTQLPEKEKLKILKQLLEAKAEAEDQGVTGGAYHAWKNGFKRTVNRLKKPLVAATLAGTMLFSVAGCAGTIESDNNTGSEPKPTETTISQVYGDFVGLEKITDEYGEYEHVTVSPDDDSMKLNPAIIDQSAYDAGFTDEEILDAQQWTTKFVAEQVMDSTALDAPKNTGYDAWASTTGGDYVLESERATILNTSPVVGQDRSSLIYGNVNDLTPTLIRDGKPRLENGSIHISKVYGGVHETIGKHLKFDYETVANYRVSTDSALETIKKQYPTWTEAELPTKVAPHLFESGEETWNTNGTLFFGVALNSDGNWAIGGYNNSFSSQANHWLLGQ